MNPIIKRINVVPKYVVVRNDIRVSDDEYDTQGDAKAEFNHWQKIINRWPDGSKLEIVVKDNRRHRVYNLK